MRQDTPNSAKFAPRLKALAAAVGLIFSAGNLVAAEHQLTKITYDANRKVDVIDMVMSIDWDFDAPPAGRDKAFIEGILRQSAQSYFTMTEGKHILGKVYVYKNSQFMDNTDIQYLLKDGRANAHVAAITRFKGGRVQQFAGTNETPVDHGKTVAHEFGHYTLGLYDEYREAGGTSTSAGSPQDGDTPRNSIMHNHLQFTNVTTATDYDDPANRKTAHFRIYGKSAWEVMVQPPASYPEAGPGRLTYQSLLGLTPPTDATLTKPTTGWENDFQVVYMGNSGAQAIGKKLTGAVPAATIASGPINTIVIDTTLSAANLKEQLRAAEQMIDNSGAANRVAVYAHPYSSAPVVPLTLLNSNATRAAVKAAIAKIAVDSSTDDSVVGERLFGWAESILPTYFPAGPTTIASNGLFYRVYSTGNAIGVTGGTLYYYDGKAIAPLGATSAFIGQAKSSLSGSLQKALDAIKSVKKIADTPSVTLLTTSTSTVDTALLKAFKDASVAVNSLGLTPPAAAGKQRLRATTPGQTSLFDLAKATSGNFKEAAKAGDLTRAGGKLANDTEGDSVQPVNEAEAASLAKGDTHTVTSRGAGGGLDGQATFSAFWDEADEGKLSFTLKTPSGTVITPTSLPAGVTYTANAGEGEASYTVPASFVGLAGVWTSSITANDATTEAVYQEVSVNSPMSAIVDVEGGTNADTRAMTATVKVSGPVAIGGATVKADITSATTGATVKSGLVLKDDGVMPDVKAGDGRYTISLADLPVGEYEIVVTATAVDGQAVYTTKGNTKMGPNGTDIPVPGFQRVTSSSFVKER
ncbi:MAG: hypothetical protein CFE44_05615 [Burkholderiales bacterium PBB4]|nr:MAG: hypothetical protein CFE44_05615 [Burkholderiales bacterium PBB4]